MRGASNAVIRHPSSGFTLTPFHPYLPLPLPRALLVWLFEREIEGEPARRFDEIQDVFDVTFGGSVFGRDSRLRIARLRLARASPNNLHIKMKCLTVSGS